MHLICNLGSDALPLVVPGQGCLAMQAELNTAAPGVLGKIPVGRSATGRLGREEKWNGKKPEKKAGGRDGYSPQLLGTDCFA